MFSGIGQAHLGYRRIATGSALWLMVVALNFILQHKECNYLTIELGRMPYGGGIVRAKVLGIVIASSSEHHGKPSPCLIGNSPPNFLFTHPKMYER